ncbi:MAG: hypothetical protein ACP5P4_16215 [Steroidobacteraceae bacterium]
MNDRKPRQPSGRAAFDERGNATWEWRSETGPLTDDIDTQRLRALGADLNCESELEPNDADAYDPYNRSTPAPTDETRPKRRTLADLRRLSEEITAARRKRDRK